MLKSYLLSEIKSNDKRERLNRLWKKQIDSLKNEDDKGDEDFIKAWLRAQYADIQFVKEKDASSVQMTLFEAEPVEKGQDDFSDFSKISGEFHKWMRDNHERLNLKTAADYERFIEEFVYFAGIYRKIRYAEENFSEETKYIFYNAQLDLI